MMTLMLMFSFAVVTAFGLESGQCKCEFWAQVRDKGL
jgi:hypothetical protein